MPGLWRRDHPRTWEVASSPPDVAPAGQPLCVTAGALADLVSSIGARPPETGAKLFGPVEHYGIDLVEFDVDGSAAAGGAVYSPDTVWGNERLDHWVRQPGAERRLWTGDAHSHPGDAGRPSPKVGPGLGDLGYVEAVFEQNEVQAEFAIPILTRTGITGTAVRINPWVVERKDPGTPRWAEFVVTDAGSFPVRGFNPAFLAGTGDHDDGLDLDLVHRLLQSHPRAGAVRRVDGAIEVEVADRLIRVDLLAGSEPVSATISDDDGHWVRVGTFAAQGEQTAEDRVVELVELAVQADAGRAQPKMTPGLQVDQPPVETSTAVTRDDYRVRTTGLLSEQFGRSTVLVVGASAGSYLVEKLARLGPERLVLIDPDTVDAANLARTAFTVDDLGRPKVDALAERLGRCNPFVAVDAHVADILEFDAGQVEQLLSGVDVIVAGTDRFAAQARLNEWSQEWSIPAVFVGLHAGGLGGIVQWSIPGETACYRCMAASRYGADTDGTTVDLHGEAGLVTDCQQVDMVAASVIIGLLERGAPTPKGRLIEVLGDRTELVVCADPAYEYGGQLVDALLADQPEPSDPTSDLRTYLGLLPVVTLPWQPDPDCPDCLAHRGEHHRTSTGV